MWDDKRYGRSRYGKLNEAQKALLEKVSQTLRTRITYRELECARYLIFGGSASCIAQKLKISPRTAEYYIENLKLKCNCDSKWQLSCYLRNQLHHKIPEVEWLECMAEYQSKDERKD